MLRNLISFAILMLLAALISRWLSQAALYSHHENELALHDMHSNHQRCARSNAEMTTVNITLHDWLGNDSINSFRYLLRISGRRSV